MTMLFYTGDPDYNPDDDPLPVVIRGIDEADNDLVSIRAGARVEGATYQLYEGYQHRWLFDAYTNQGVATPAGIITYTQPPPSWRPHCCAVRADGWIFAPSAAYITNSIISDGAGGYVLGHFCLDWIRVYRRAGDRVDFPQLHGARICAIAFDADGNILVGGDQQGANRYHLRKYTADGATLTWSVAAPSRTDGGRQLIQQIIVGPDGSIYVRGDDGLEYSTTDHRGFIAKYNSSGVEQWKITNSGLDSVAPIWDMLLLDGNLYTAGVLYYAGVTGYTDIQKRSTSTGAVTAGHLGQDAYALAANGTEPHAIRYATTGWDHREYDPADLSVLLEETLSLPLYSPAGHNFLFDSAGTLRACERPPSSYYYLYADPTRVQIVSGTQTPPIPLALGLAPFTWIGDTYTLAPAVPLSIALAIPTPRREYTGALRLPDTYLATLSGTPDLDIPISSFSIRRDLSGVSLSVVSPFATADQIDAILARTAGTLTLWRGVRFLDGAEQVEPMLAVPMDGAIRYDIGARSGSVTLSGDATETPTGGQTRTLIGISYRSDSSGKRRVRCAVDTYLRPGDTADLGGGETITVAELSYQVDATQASMEVAE